MQCIEERPVFFPPLPHHISLSCNVWVCHIHDYNNWLATPTLPTHTHTHTLSLSGPPRPTLYQVPTNSFFFRFVGLAYQGKDIVFRFIIEYSSLMGFGP